MRFSEYLYSKAVTLCFLAIGLIIFGAFFAAAGMDPMFLFIMALSFLLLCLLWLLVSFLLTRERFRKLDSIADSLPEKYLLGEVLPKPSDPIELAYYRVMKLVSRSALGQAEQAKRDKEDYCEYVESWIHEMKTPLTASSLILTKAQEAVIESVLLANPESHLDAEIEPDREAVPVLLDSLERLRRELKRADNLTESILYYARIRTPGKEIQIGDVSADALIQDAVRSQMELLIAAGIHIETEGNFELHTDGRTVTFILKQLLINCAKYCPGCHVRITAQDGQITLEDDGIGISSYELPRVTERGYTGTNGKRTGGSTGMGLYIVKELCTQLDIRLEITSTEGAYTRVALNFL